MCTLSREPIKRLLTEQYDFEVIFWFVFITCSYLRWLPFVTIALHDFIYIRVHTYSFIYSMFTFLWLADNYRMLW